MSSYPFLLLDQRNLSVLQLKIDMITKVYSSCQNMAEAQLVADEFWKWLEGNPSQFHTYSSWMVQQKQEKEDQPKK